MAEQLLELNNLCIKYGEFLAVSDVSMKMPEGSLVSIIGANGSGKTTLMNTIAGLLSPSSGTVILDGENVTGFSTEKMVRRGLSLVPQGGHVFSRMSVMDNLLVGSFGKNARASGKQTLEKVLELFPVLYEKRKLPAGSLSGGQRQMVAIGRALMSSPRLILFDELSLGLAPVVIKDIYATIRKISKEESVSIVIVEQDTRRAMQMSDYTYIMLKGKVVLEGPSAKLTPEEVKEAYFGL